MIGGLLADLGLCGGRYWVWFVGVMGWCGLEFI